MKLGLVVACMGVLVILGFPYSPAYADPPLPLPRLPICGDQDGSETPFRFRCPDLIPTADVQTYRVPGDGDIDLRFDFVFREATFNNELVVFVADDPSGSVNGLSPGDAGYLAAVFDRSTVIFQSGSTAITPDVTLTFQADDILVFFIVQNSTLANLLAQNPSNELGKLPLAFFSIDAVNPDGVDHFVGFQSTTDPFTQFGFEDLTGGGDVDYDDIVYNVRPPLEAIPLALEPVILLPGIGGSEIVTTRSFNLSVPDGHGGIWQHTYPAGESVWPNLGEAIDLFPDDDDYFDVLKLEQDGRTPATPLLGDLEITGLVKVSVPLFGEQGYGAWTPYFEAQGYETGINLFEFPYDFRLDIDEVLDELDNQVTAALVAANGGKTDESQWTINKVDFVTHSMGGTIVRAYISDAVRAARVDQVIAIAPAYLGAPKFLKALLFGETFAFVHPEELKDVIQNWPGGFEVSPSRLYWMFYDGSDPTALAVPFREDRDFDGDGNELGPLDYDQTKLLLQNLGTNMTVFNLAEEFHNELDTSWDGGIPVPEIHVISGSGHCTQGQFRTYFAIDFTIPFTDTRIRLLPRMDVLEVNGDGTVPLFSTTLSDPSRGIDHRDGAEVYYTDLKHNTIHQPAQGTVMEFAASILRGNPQVPSDFLQEPNAATCTEISVFSPVELHAFDSAGKHTGLIGDDGHVFEVDIPQSAYEELGESKFVILEQDGLYTIEARALAEGHFDMRIRDYEDGQLIQTIIYLRVPVTDATVGQLTLDTRVADLPVVRLDHNADGTVEEEFEPSTVLDGLDSLDGDPPSITILSPEDGQAYSGEVLLSWTIADDISGVFNELTILDAGTPTAQVVENNTHVELSPGDHTLTIAAEDRAGNGNLQEVTFSVSEAAHLVEIDIWPFLERNIIFLGKDHPVPVAILSTDSFDSPNEVDKESLTFGRTGDEESLKRCLRHSFDVDKDGLKDLICVFRSLPAGFQEGDTEGVLKGLTIEGVLIEGRDAVLVLPAKETSLFQAFLNGDNEVPKVVTDGRGHAVLRLRRRETDLSFLVSFWRMEDIAAIHIHCAPEGENGPVGVTLYDEGNTNQRYFKGVIKGPDAGNECGWDSLDAVVMAMRSGDTYINVHTEEHPDGEIRGQIDAVGMKWD